MSVNRLRLVEGPISCFAFSKDKQTLALSPASSTNDIHLYSLSPASNKYVLDQVLENVHDQRITGLDWSPTIPNCFVSCSQDRNAFVWHADPKSNTNKNNKWIPKMVLLRLSKAATCVKWSPDGKKFAVGSSSKAVSLCYYDDILGWWKSKHIKDDDLIRSTITCLDWHPNSSLLAVGSSDFHVRVYSAALREVDAKPPTSNWMEKVKKEGSLLAEFADPYYGWVSSLSFSPSGQQLAWVSRSSVIGVASGPASDSVHIIAAKELPYTSVLFTSESSLVVAGYDCKPYLYTKKPNAGAAWELAKCIDTTDQQKTGISAVTSAISMFKKLDIHGQKSGEEHSDVSLKSINQNSIVAIRPHTTAADKITQFTTLGLDGHLVTWAA